MTNKEMKNVLVSKFKDENCNFSMKDISIVKMSEKITDDFNNEVERCQTGFIMTIKDYEHIPFTMVLEEDEYFGFIVMIENDFDDYTIFVDCKKEYDIERALIQLGYYIATRF